MRIDHCGMRSKDGKRDQGQVRGVFDVSTSKELVQWGQSQAGLANPIRELVASNTV